MTAHALLDTTPDNLDFFELSRESFYVIEHGGKGNNLCRGAGCVCMCKAGW
jgi:hypothetical protein